MRTNRRQHPAGPVDVVGVHPLVGTGHAGAPVLAEVWAAAGVFWCARARDGWRFRGRLTSVGGRESEVETFVREQAPALLRAATALTGDPVEAQDLVQHTLVQVWRHWTRVRAARNPTAYVHRALVNAHLSERRRSRWQHERLTAELPERPTVVEATALPYELIRALPERQKAALVLRYVADLDDAGIAAALGCSPSTVRSHISRALTALRDQLKEIPDAH